MPKYLVCANYTSTGMRGLLTEGGSKRRDAATAAMESLGAKVEAFYFAFGDNDVYVIVDAPDNVTTAGMCLAIGASGAVSTKTIVLLTPEEVDQAVKKSVDYRPPGG